MKWLATLRLRFWCWLLPEFRRGVHKLKELSTLRTRVADLESQLRLANQARAEAEKEALTMRALRDDAETRASQAHQHVEDNLKHVVDYMALWGQGRSIFHTIPVPERPPASTVPIDPQIPTRQHIRVHDSRVREQALAAIQEFQLNSRAAEGEPV